MSAIKRPREEPTLTLYSYWRSSSAWRVRIALNLKNLSYKYVAINLLKNEDSSPEYLAINPAGMLPTLVVEEADGSKLVLSESLAILEYLEERFPGGENAILPESLEGRATARRLSLHIAAAVQPLQNNVVLGRIEKLALSSGASAADAAAAKTAWAKTHILEGLEIFAEALQRDRSGNEWSCCCGNKPTIVDCLLIPQLYNAERFGVKLETELPSLYKIQQHLQTIPAFADAVPEKMSDAPPSA